MRPRLLETIAQARAWRRAATGSVGLVPTMGALHAGHEALFDAARAANNAVAASIFVNPTQFNDSDDFTRYPRTFDRDLSLCEAHGVAAVFCPSASEIYPPGFETYIEAPRVTERLCGKFRPGHFRGVATVVVKLLNIMQPDRAYFGEKDAQQLALIRAVARDLDLPVEIVGVPTVREPDGLALSSRNARLSSQQRSAAPRLNQALEAASTQVANGETDPAAVHDAALALLAAELLIRPEYFEVVDLATMQPVEKIDRPVLLAAAAWLGEVRLIDNRQANPPTSTPPSP